MCLKKFKEDYVFTKYKDKCFKNSATLKGEIIKNYPGVDAEKLHVRIVNYQIDKYGDILRRQHRGKNVDKRLGGK